MRTERLIASLTLVGVAAVCAATMGCPGELDDESRFRVDGGGTSQPADTGASDTGGGGETGGDAAGGDAADAAGD